MADISEKHVSEEAEDAVYIDRYVAFLDILGFSDMTKRADGEPNWREFLRRVIRNLNQTLPKQIEHSGFRFVQFSDCIVLTANRTPQALLTIMSGCSMLVRNMLERSILLRGGIAAGKLHHDDEMMFGPALLAAYAFDKRGAPPHIGIDRSVMADLEIGAYGPTLAEFITEDPWDLTPMLHVLRQFEDYDAVPRVGAEILDKSALGIAIKLVDYSTNMESQPAARAKWKWMRDYYNRSVSKRGILVPAEIGPVGDMILQLADEAQQGNMTNGETGGHSR